MLPKIAELEFNTEEIPEDLPKIGKSFLYDFKNGDFVLKDGKMVEIHDLESLKVWIEKVIRTEQFRFRIYDGETYGVTIEDLIGTNYPMDFIESELKREITSSLIRHQYIERIQDWTFRREKSFMYITFTVVTIDGAFEQEVTLNV